MLANADLYLIWAFVTVLGFWASSNGQARQFVLVASSVLFVFTLAPWSLLIALYAAAAGFFILHLRHAREIHIPYYAILILLIGPIIASKAAWALYGRPDTNTQLLISLGLGFFTLRVYAAVMDGIKSKSAYPPGQFLAVTFFFPIYTAGPIEPIKTFDARKLENPFKLDFLIWGAVWIAIGFFKSFYFADYIIIEVTKTAYPQAPGDFSSMSFADGLGYTLLRFAHTYIAYSGYMDIAIGTSTLFGIKIMENFNLPFLATNIREFWQRWHISLGRFVQNYMFFPLFLKLRTPARAQVASILSFLLIGLWHEISVQYALWGILHGLGFALAWTLADQKPPLLRRIAAIPGVKYVFMLLTILFVSFVQTLANLPSTAAIIDYLLVFFP